MNKTVLQSLTYGLYVVGAMDNERPVGCIINTCFQVTSENPILAVSINKNNYTLKAIKSSGKFSLSILAEDSDSSVIGAFGFISSRDTDKYADYGYDMLSETPIVKGLFAGRIVLDVLSYVDNETHVVVLGRVIDTQVGSGVPMTYAYYHNVIKGKAPKSAPTYVEEEVQPQTNRYVCDICGYVHEADSVSPDFVCPICRVDYTHFK